MASYLCICSLVTESRDTMLRDGMVVTGPGKLLCKNIIHIRARGTIAHWVEAIFKCLKKVEELGHNSVAFPALGTGKSPAL